MISKQNLIKKIDEVCKLKEELMPLLDKHITAAISFSGLAEDERSDIVQKMKYMAIEQSRHNELLKDIKESVVRGNSNAY